jgi:hypothetical protein
MGMLLFWCIKFNGAKTLFLLSKYASWSVGPVGVGWISFVMFWLCIRAQTRIIYKRENREKSLSLVHDLRRSVRKSKMVLGK